MRTAGIREVRQNLSALLREVRKGREIVITDRGEPVARLTPPARGSARPFPDLADFRARLPQGGPPLSAAIVEDRGDRL
jgi:prevent-host-death family protein